MRTATAGSRGRAVRLARLMLAGHVGALIAGALAAGCGLDASGLIPGAAGASVASGAGGASSSSGTGSATGTGSGSGSGAGGATSGGATTGGAGGEATASSGSISSSGGGGATGSGGAPPDAGIDFCGEPDLIACYRFDGNLEDGSGNGQEPDVGLVAGYVAGIEGQAVALDASSEVHMANDAPWNAPVMTLELWMRPSAIPAAGQRAGLMDKDGQFGMWLYPPGTPGGMLRCGAGDLYGGGTVDPGVWTHFACTHDGTTVRLYKNGIEVASKAAGTGVTASEIAIGSNVPGYDSRFVGDIDALRAFAVARTAAQICAAAGGGGG